MKKAFFFILALGLCMNDWWIAGLAVWLWGCFVTTRGE